MQQLPKALKREPLVDAVFEMRLKGKPQLADILPGILFHELSPKPVVTRLPAAEIPQPIRKNIPNLQFAPLMRLERNKFSISVGERNIVISCILPYPKWPKFKKEILDIIAQIAGVGIIESVGRYSLKYVNAIAARTLAEQIKKIKMGITLGPVEVKDDAVNIRVDRIDNDIVHVLSLITGASGQLPNGNTFHGVVVDIDSIRNINQPDLATFEAEFELGLEQLRQKNKAIFFSCLTDTTIEEMGPVYE